MDKETIYKNPVLKLSFDFALGIIQYCELLESDRKFVLARQLLKSGTSIGANAIEAQNAESKPDFVHKFKIILKELRETNVSLKIIKRKPLTKKIELVDIAMKECNELISIFVKSIETANRNKLKVS